MTGRLKMTTGLGLLAIGLALSGCTAFADAVDGGGNGFDGGVGLVIEPWEYIRQGQKADYTIQFTKPPPWKDRTEDGSSCVLTKMTWVELDNPNHKIDDIERVTDYCNISCEGCEVDTITAILQAAPDADTKANRLLVWEVSYSEFGKPQQLWRGSARFWVFPSNGTQVTDGGTDGADDGTDAGADDGGD